jgi:hypothetical protein
VATAAVAVSMGSGWFAAAAADFRIEEDFQAASTTPRTTIDPISMVDPSPPRREARVRESMRRDLQAMQ